MAITVGGIKNCKHKWEYMENNPEEIRWLCKHCGSLSWYVFDEATEELILSVLVPTNKKED